MVVELVTKQLKIPYKSIKRVNYNFYHTLSEGDYHIDTNTPKCVSILYNLNKNNGIRALRLAPRNLAIAP